jgi:hypothetical protein
MRIATPPLSHAPSSPCSNSPKKKLTLHIETPGRTWTFCPEDSTKCTEWVERIKEVANFTTTESFDENNTQL